MQVPRFLHLRIHRMRVNASIATGFEEPVVLTQNVSQREPRRHSAETGQIYLASAAPLITCGVSQG
jgi:hypothetical protein